MVRCSFFILFYLSLFASWAEETLKNMTLEEKIGQLFVIPICPKRDEKHLQDLFSVIETYHVGGVIPKASNRQEQIAMLAILQEKSKFPLLCYMDAEWGLGMRMEGEISFPKNSVLGRCPDDNLLYKMGKEVGISMKEVGGHVNLAPVADLFSHPLDPIIQHRSFGSDPKVVGEKVVWMMKGLHDGGIIATIKHFPGHGNVTVDPHLDLPLSYLSKEALIPFQMAIDAGCEVIMSSHILYPDISDLPGPMTKEVMHDLLRTQMGFQGILISDAMNMQGIQRYFSPGKAAVGFLEAGHDILLYGDHINPHIDHILQVMIPEAFKAVKESIEKGELFIDDKVLKILKLKQKLGLVRNRFVSYKENDRREIQEDLTRAIEKSLSVL